MVISDCITIKSHLAKLYEYFVNSRIKKGLSHIIMDEKYGCRPGKSIISSSDVFKTYISELIERDGQINVIFTDFRKSYYTVDHIIYYIFCELDRIGIYDSANFLVKVIQK